MSIEVEIGSGSPEGVVNKAPGYLYTQTNNTTLWRKAGGSGTDTTGWIRGDLNVYNIMDFGAKCDGTSLTPTDDWQAWSDAISAAEANVKGVVFHPGGVSCISDTIRPANNSAVQFIGGPGAVVKALSTFPITTPKPIIEINSTVGGFGSRYGAMRDLQFDGNGRARVGLYVYAVQREFENVVVRNCTEIGLLLPGAQNCSFISCQFEENGSGGQGANCVLELGAGNNAFFCCQFNVSPGIANGGPQCHLLIRQNGAQLDGAFAQPEANTFDACQFERGGLYIIAAIIQSAGRNNSLISCTIQRPSYKEDFFSAIVIGSEGGESPPASSTLTLINCRVHSDADSETTNCNAIYADTPDVPAAILSNNLFEGFSSLFVVNDPTCIDVAMPNYLPEVPIVTPIGSDQPSGLLAQRTLQMPGLPTSAPPMFNGMSPWMHDPANQLVHFYSNYQGNPDWRSVDLVRQTIYSTAALTANTSVTIYNLGVRYHRIIIGTLASNITVTIGNPSFAHVGLRVTIELSNTNSNANTVAFNFGSLYKLGAALAALANGTTHMICFEWNGTNWRETSRSESQLN